PDKEEKKKKEKEQEKKEEPRKAQQNQKSEAELLEELRVKLRAGSVVCVYDDAQHRGKWYPAVVVALKVYRDLTTKGKNLGKNEIPVRSFQNGKYFAASLANLVLLDDQPISKKALDAMSNPQRTAVDRANAFNSKGTLPNNWIAKEIYADTSIPRKKEPVKADTSIKTAKKDDKAETSKKEDDAKKKKAIYRVESSSETSESSGEEEYGEERDLFVAQLYKFQEERGTPINRAPILGGKDIDLYRFYRVVQDYGGCKRVTTNQLWKKVLIKLHLSGCPGATPVTVRKAYIRYLAHFNSFYKRLGWSLDELSITSTINSPRERRLIRNAELMNQQKPVKRRKSSAAEAKEKTTKRGKADGRESKETSRDPDGSSQRERSTCSPSTSTSSEKPKKLEKEEDEKKAERKQKDEDVKEKKEKKEKAKEREKEEKAKDKETKSKIKKEEEVKEMEEKRGEKLIEKIKEEEKTEVEHKHKSSPSKAEQEADARAERSERRDSEREKNAAAVDKDGVHTEKRDHDISDEDG
ncbi:unnamed protein product, partial [Cylicocyclus nassatus]